MKGKKFLIFAIFAILMTNASILITLYLAGHFGGGSEPSEEQKAQASTAEEGSEDGAGDETAAKPKPEPVKRFVIKELQDARPICDEKLRGKLKGKPASYYFDRRMSYFDKITDGGTWKVIYNIEYLDMPGEPGYFANVTCDVVATTGKISNFIHLKK